MKFKEEYLFLKYKDKGFNSSRTFEREINKNYKGVDAKKLYLRVLRYQIKRYGGALMAGDLI